MKRIISTGIIMVLLISSALMAGGCTSGSGSGDPIASFTTSTSNGAAALKITFSNTSENAGEFEWDFGDGGKTTTSNVEETVEHEYIKVGSYDVELTAISGKDPAKKDTARATISVTAGQLDDVKITPNEVTLDVGGSHEFSVECTDSYGNVIKDYQLSWDVLEGVGNISLGSFTAGTKAGSFTDVIVATVKSGDVTKKGTASVTVNSHNMEAVSISPIEIGAGEEMQLQVSIVDEYGNEISGVTPIWSITNDSAGTITHDGILTAGKRAGNYSDAVEVKVKQGDVEKRATARVVVVPGKIEQISIVPEVVAIGMKQEQQFIAMVADDYGNHVEDFEIQWTSDSDAGVISPDGFFSSGLIAGKYKDGVKAEITRKGVTLSVTSDVTVEPDRIVYLSNEHDEDNENYELYIINADGSNKRQLTSFGGSGVGMKAACSVDGRRLAVITEGSIHTMNTYGEWITTIMTDTDSMGVTWSPDGTKIALDILDMDNNKADIYVIDADGSNLVQLTDNPYYDIAPRWSPDGKKIAFASSRDRNWEIYIMNPDGTNQKKLTDSEWIDIYPEWSSGSDNIIFQSNRNSYYYGIYSIDVDGSSVKTIFAPGDDQAYGPCISPDGSQVVFHMSLSSNDMDIYVINMDGSGKTRLMDNTAADVYPIWLQRKSGVSVSKDMITFTDKSGATQDLTVQEVTARVRNSVVRIETDGGSGSGVIIGSDGIILTCNHVISDAEEITVYLEDGTSYPGTVEGRDPVHDLALVKINATGLSALDIGSFEEVELGQRAIVIGYPLGNANISVTSGLVSAIEYDSGRNITWIQTDSAVNPGNSGGPMLNLKGQVIGIVSAKLVGESIEGIGYAISTLTLNLYLQMLLGG